MSPSRSPHENGDRTSSVGAGPRAFESQDEDIQPPFSPFVDTQHHTHLPLFDQSSNNTSMDILSVVCLNPAPIGPPPPAPSAAAAVSSVSAVPVNLPLPGAPSAFMADFPPQPIPSSADEMQGIDVVPSPPTSSSNPSLVASPVPIHDQTPPFASHTSSLATALDDPSAAVAATTTVNIVNGGSSLVTRSRSGSLASPSASMLSSRSAEIGNLHANDLSSRPDPVAAPHMLAADDVLEKIIRAASSAREACSLGEPAQANAKVDEMKRSIMLVSHLLAATTIDTGSAPTSDVGSPPRTLPHAHSSPPGGLHTQSPNLVSSFPDTNNNTPNGSAGPILAQPTASIPTAMDTMSSLDPGDMTRKRCASSMAADSRVQKALKLEPPEDDDVMPLSQMMPPMSMLLPSPGDSTSSTASSVSAAAAGGVMGGGVGSAAQPIVVQSIPVLPPLVSTPPSAPPSRPGSRGGSDWAVLSSSAAAAAQQQSPIPLPVPSSSNNFGLSLNLANAAAATRAGVNIPSPFPSPIKTRPGGAWSDLQAPTTLPPLTHSLSHPLSHTHSHLPHPLQQSDIIPPQPPTSSSSVSIPSLAEFTRGAGAAGVQQQPTQPLSFGGVGLPLPVSNYPLPPGAPVSPPTTLPLPPPSALIAAAAGPSVPSSVASTLVRQSRSSSISNPFAYSPSAAVEAQQQQQHAQAQAHAHDFTHDFAHDFAQHHHIRTRSRPTTAFSSLTNNNANNNHNQTRSPSVSSDDDSEYGGGNGGSGSGGRAQRSRSRGRDREGGYGSRLKMGSTSNNNAAPGSTGGVGGVASQQQQQQQLAENGNAGGAGGGVGAHGNEIPVEFRAEVDRIFFQFMNKICSNLDATDAKGEPIHQTLMAKKMQRLDESPDFRPFKFRIQAFTNAFLEELAFQGYPEDKIPMKKVRNYLWNQPFISRFNEDGKKAKSKGNHIWNIDAKKLPEGGWTFRPFHRKLAGSPPSVAYVGLRWSWAPRIWDPQASRTNIPLEFSSPALPSWLSWEDGILSGTPPPDAQACDVTVEARCIQDGREETLVQTFHINIAPMSGSDTSFATSRRPSLTNDPRRVNSDSVLPQASGTVPRFVNAGRLATESGDMHEIRPLPRTQSSLGQPGLQPAVPVATQDAQMMQVLTSAAQRVAQEAQAHVIAARSPHDATGPQLQALAKQQHVLTVTAQALDHEVTASHPDAVSPSSNVLVAAAQQVVLQAARQVAADRSAVAAMSQAISHATGMPAPPASSSQVTVNEVSVATQTAVAQAVDITGPLSSEVDVMMTASSLLQQQTLTQQQQTISANVIEPAPLVTPPPNTMPPPPFPSAAACGPMYPQSAPPGMLRTDFLAS